MANTTSEDTPPLSSVKDEMSETSEFLAAADEQASQLRDSRVQRGKRYLSHHFHRLRHTRYFSFHMLKRLVVVVFSLALLITAAVFAIKHIKQEIEYANASDFPDFSNPKEKKLSRKNLASRHDFPFEVGCREIDASGPRANASFVMLCRNSELGDVVHSMRSMEKHFNQWFEYPWVFLNDEEFSDEFKSTVRKHTKAEIEFGLVPKNHWDFENIKDKEAFEEHIQAQGDRQVMYGNMESYHKMCRFYSGHFYDHPLVRKRDWYWRVEPDVDFFCDLTYDPFVEMEKHGKVYGFTIALGELYYTVPSLFMVTKAFIKEKNIQVQSAWDIVTTKFRTVRGENAALYNSWSDQKDLEDQVRKNVNWKRFLKKKNKTNQDLEKIKDFKDVRDIFDKAAEKPPLFLDRLHDEEYNLCHFWTNFEIARTDFFLGEDYQAYIKYLEESGGFYKERWGDAPVHSLAVSMLLPREKLHYFREIGYQHTTLAHCPNNAPGKQLPYKANGFVDDEKPWYDIFRRSGPDKPVKNGVGCRCECPRGFATVEDRHSTCLRRYAQVMADDFEPFPEPFNLDRMERKTKRVRFD